MLSSQFFPQKVSNTFQHLDMKYHDHIFHTDPPIKFISEKVVKPHALVTTLEILPNVSKILWFPLWKCIKILWSPLCKCIKYPMVPPMKINQKSYGLPYENVSEILWSPLWKCTKKNWPPATDTPPEKSQNRNSGGVSIGKGTDNYL